MRGSVSASMLAVAACAAAGPVGAAQITEVRDYFGLDNNLSNPGWGTKFTPTLRGPSGSHYPDGVGEQFAGPDRPNPRIISNALCDQPEYIPDLEARSDFVWAWGQFVDHDISLAPEQLLPPEKADIAVPAGDPFFDPDWTGRVTMAFERTQQFIGDAPLVPREQFNDVSAFLDASQVYGGDPFRALKLRRLDGSGKLDTSDSPFGDMLPFNESQLPNAKDPEGQKTDQFFAGDVRANEHIVLTSLHVLFVREHNWWCDRLAKEHPEWDGETIYQMARKIVGAELAVITYRDYLPTIVGDRVPPYAGYDPGLDPGIRHAFSTAAFRLGHTQVSGLIIRLGEDGAEIDEGHILVRDAYFNPTILPTQQGVEPVLRGLAAQVQEQTDLKVKDDLRNFLFGALFGNPDVMALDLVSLNIRRGRDHGLPDFNTVRTDYGLTPRASFSEITSDDALASALEALYLSVDDIDPWVGVLAEDPLDDAVLGETGVTIIVDQFTRLRDGDRLWFENDPDLLARPDLLAEIDAVTLRDIVLRNTTIGAFPENPFFACGLTGDVDKSKAVDTGDLNIVLGSFGLEVQPGDDGDVNGTGVVDQQDLLMVLEAYGLACDR